MHRLLLSLFILSSGILNAQDLSAYRLYDSDGKATDFGSMMKDLTGTEVILFGELHNDPIAHWLQLEVARYIHEDGHTLVIGAEMFERDDEEILQAYLADSIDEAEMDSLIDLWPNYKTDYKPVLEYAHAQEIDFIGTNVPRRFAGMVFRYGFEALDSLSPEEKKWMAELPIPYDPDLSCYREMLAMGHGHGGENLPKAQALKDATMAWFILQKRSKKTVFLHLNGDYHSADHQGIAWYLQTYRPKTKIKTISTVLSPDANEFPEEARGKADYILVVNERVTRTY